MMVIHTYDHPIHSNILGIGRRHVGSHVRRFGIDIGPESAASEGLGSRPTIPTDPWDRWVEMATTMVNIISVTVT